MLYKKTRANQFRANMEEFANIPAVDTFAIANLMSLEKIARVSSIFITS